MKAKKDAMIKGLYTSLETRTKLSVSPSTLKSLVEKEIIVKVIPPGYQNGYYTKESVDNYWDQQQAFKQSYDIVADKDSEDVEEEVKKVPGVATAKFVRVTTRDEMSTCQEISQELFGVGRDTTDERMLLAARNPDTYHMLKGDNGIIGYVATMPLKVGSLDGVLQQTIPVRIAPDAIEDFSKNKEVDLYLHAIGVRPGLTPTEKKVYSSRLIAGVIAMVVDWGKQGITINTIAARSNMPDGINLMRHAGFTEIEPPTPERRTYIIRVNESGLPFIMRYKKALREATTRVATL